MEKSPWFLNTFPLLFADLYSLFEIKYKYYNGCILYVITYACPIWGCACKTSMDNLSRFHNKQRKFIRNDSTYLRNSTIRNNLKTYSLINRIKFLSKKFTIRYIKFLRLQVRELPDVYISSNRKRHDIIVWRLFDSSKQFKT